MSLLFIAAILGLIPAFIAQSKGRSFGAWWLYGALLFIVAIIHVLVIPSDSTTSINSSDNRICPFCAEPIRRQAIKCSIAVVRFCQPLHCKMREMVLKFLGEDLQHLL